MTDEEYRRIVSRNIKRIAYDNHKTQADIVRDLNLKQPTVSSWMNGTRMIQMPEIDLLCHYFNCKRSDIMEEYNKAGARAERESAYISQIETVCTDLNEDSLRRLAAYASRLQDLQRAEEELE